MYEPAEDSYLLLNSVTPVGTILEMCTGSGIIAGSISKKGYDVTAVDIDVPSLEYAQKHNVGPIYLQSDLFSNVSGMYDTIICNPPYLPDDVIGGNVIEDKALYAGKQGYELIIDFLSQAVSYLVDDGNIYLLFSNLSQPSVILRHADSLMLSYEKVQEQFVGLGETLYVYRFWKSSVWFSTCDLEDLCYLTHGKHGVLWTAKLADEKVVVKAQQGFASPSVQVIKEARMLQEVNKIGLGPRYIRHDDVHVVMSYVDGRPFHKVDHSLALLQELMRQCYELDKIGISKEELRRPRSNILVGEDVVMIDFERSHYDPTPRNVTQYSGFLLVHDYLPAQAISLLRQYTPGNSEVYNTLYSMICGPNNSN